MAANKEDYLSGKAKWAKLHKPDLKYKKWSIVLYPDAPSLEKIRAWKEMVGPIKNVIKRDEDGDSITLNRPTSKDYRSGIRTFTPPIILDSSKKLPDGSFMPLADGVLIGNGSDVTCKLEIYSYKSPVGAREHALRLVSVLVNELVPYVPAKDFTDMEKESVEGLVENAPKTAHVHLF